VTDMRKHDGGEMPCEPNDFVMVKQRNGDRDWSDARNFGWRHRLGHDGEPWPGDIVGWDFVEDRNA